MKRVWFIVAACCMAVSFNVFAADRYSDKYKVFITFKKSADFPKKGPYAKLLYPMILDGSSPLSSPPKIFKRALHPSQPIKVHMLIARGRVTPVLFGLGTKKNYHVAAFKHCLGRGALLKAGIRHCTVEFHLPKQIQFVHPPLLCKISCT